jgi:ArsR family transcriptional regulator
MSRGLRPSGTFESTEIDMSRSGVLPLLPILKQTPIDMTSVLPTLPAGPAAAQCCAPSAGLNLSLDAERIAAVAKALAEPVRVQILDVLRRSEQRVCQCELIPLFGITQPLLSHHMKKLIDAGVVQVERRHKWAYYSVSTDALKELTAWLG